MGLFSVIKKHFSFLVMASGAASLYLANILFKDILSASDYGLYSLILTYVAMLYSYGYLGLEQSFIRISDFSKMTLLTSKSLVGIMSVLLIVFPLLSVMFFRIDNPSLHFFSLWGVFTGITLLMLLYNILRLNQQFVLSQSVVSLWRVLLFITAIYFIFSEDSLSITSLPYLLAVFMFLGVLIAVGGLYKMRIQFNDDGIRANKQVFRLSIGFAISMLNMTLLATGDKFMIEHYLGLDELGEYFYISSLFLYPFLLLQNYVGFKELVHFKKHIDLPLLNAVVRKVFFAATGFAALVYVLVYLAVSTAILPATIFNKKDIVILLIAMGILRLCYAPISAAMGAIANPNMLKKANSYSIGFSILLLLICYGLFGFSIFSVVAGFFALWVLRIAVWYHFTRKELLTKE